MYFKIFNVAGPSCPTVLVQVERDDEGEDFVRITAWHTVEGEELIQVEEVHFGDGDNVLQKCKMFVANMSKEYAQDVAESFQF